jgi:glycosyltransferase involved in cell wall biosynthesis
MMLVKDAGRHAPAAADVEKCMNSGSRLLLAALGGMKECDGCIMRLAIEITTCTSSRTGVGYYTEHLVDALLKTRAAGDDVILLSNRLPAEELTRRWSPNLRVGGPGVRALWMQTEVPRMLDDAGVDVAVFPNYAVPLAAPCPTVVVVHDLTILRMPQHCTLQKRLLMAPMLRQAVKVASVIATVSEASQRDIESFLGVARSRIALLPGAAHPSCRPAASDTVTAVTARHGLSRPYVLTVGTLEPRKDLVTLLRAFDQLERDLPEHDLVVVGGRGWQDRQLVQALEARMQSRRVRWLGYVSEPDLVALYTGADLFVFTSMFEGFGLPVLEAMACGAPVVASDVAALREVGGDVARFAPPGDPAAFARTISESLRDPEARAAARRAGPERAARFSWTRTAEALWARARTAGSARIRVGSGRSEAPTPVREAVPAREPLPSPLHPPPAGLSAREWALLATVVYADLFDSPLPLEQATRAGLGVALDEAEIHRLVRGPALAPLLTLDRSGFLVLVGREHLLEAIPEREEATRKLLDANRGILASLSALPFVRALVISGGVAHRNPGRRPDVDFFAVTAHGRAYTAYTALFLATKLTGTRQVICPNYLVEESELAIAYHHDLFTAHQLVSALPFSGKHTYEALCHANEGWIRKFFPSFVPRDAVEPAAAPSTVQWVGELALAPIAPALEGLLRAAWRFRLRRRAATAPNSDVVLATGILKLHLSDYRLRVLDRFSRRLDVLRGQIIARSAPEHAELESVGT